VSQVEHPERQDNRDLSTNYLSEITGTNFIVLADSGGRWSKSTVRRGISASVRVQPHPPSTVGSSRTKPKKPMSWKT